MPGGARPRAGVVSSYVNKIYGRERAEDKEEGPAMLAKAIPITSRSARADAPPQAGRGRAWGESGGRALFPDISLSDSSDDDVKPFVARPATAGQPHRQRARSNAQKLRSAVRSTSPSSPRNPLDSSFTTDESVTSSPAAPRFRNRCRWNQEPDSKRKCRGSATVLQRNAGVCESCQSLRARWAARLVAEFPTVMSRSQLNTLLDKHMDLNRCRLILEVCARARAHVRAAPGGVRKRVRAAMLAVFAASAAVAGTVSKWLTRIVCVHHCTGAQGGELKQRLTNQARAGGR